MKPARMMYICAVALAMCWLSGVARAYSEEAVADGERLLATTVERAKAGEASAQDIAVVRYHLLEMKLAAGRITQRAFCPLARAELQTMLTAAGDEETKAGIVELEDRFAAMTTTPELCRQASAAVDAFLFDERAGAPSDADAAEAERTSADAERRYKAGEIDRSEAARAAANALQAQYEAGKLGREAYCRSAQGQTLADLARWVEASAQVGQAALLEQLDARRRLFRFKALCLKRN